MVVRRSKFRHAVENAVGRAVDDATWQMALDLNFGYVDPDFDENNPDDSEFQECVDSVSGTVENVLGYYEQRLALDQDSTGPVRRARAMRRAA